MILNIIVKFLFPHHSLDGLMIEVVGRGRNRGETRGRWGL